MLLPFIHWLLEDERDGFVNAIVALLRALPNFKYALIYHSQLFIDCMLGLVLLREPCFQVSLVLHAERVLWELL